MSPRNTMFRGVSSSAIELQLGVSSALLRGVGGGEQGIHDAPTNSWLHFLDQTPINIDHDHLKCFEDTHGKGHLSRHSPEAQRVIWISLPNGLA